MTVEKKMKKNFLNTGPHRTPLFSEVSPQYKDYHYYNIENPTGWRQTSLLFIGMA